MASTTTTMLTTVEPTTTDMLASTTTIVGPTPATPCQHPTKETEGLATSSSPAATSTTNPTVATSGVPMSNAWTGAAGSAGAHG